MTREQHREQPSGMFPTLFKFPTHRFPSFANWPSMHWPMFNEMEQELLGDFLSQKNGLTLSEDQKNIYIEAAMPGLKAEDIDVSFDQGILMIKGDKKEETEDKEKTFYRRASSTYSYQLSLPSHVDANKEPKASYKDGIMKITFAKEAHSQAKKIPVKNG